jgi:hypothetical protein
MAAPKKSTSNTLTDASKRVLSDRERIRYAVVRGRLNR